MTYMLDLGFAVFCHALKLSFGEMTTRQRPPQHAQDVVRGAIDVILQRVRTHGLHQDCK